MLFRSATFTTPVDGVTPASARVELIFHRPGADGILFTADDQGAPLPDDRFSLTVFDRIVDGAGNPLDGESGANGPFNGNDVPATTPPIFPTGDGQHGGDFWGRFTVDSRPELGVWAAGSVWVDTNGNFVFDPTNLDAVNRDIVYKLGLTSDNIFAGNFSQNANSVTDGFDKLAAYGRVNGSFRWLVDTDNDGVANIAQVDPAAVSGHPVAGRFDNNNTNGDEVGLFDGTRWHFDTNHDYRVDFTLNSTLVGYPVVGDFDRDGFDDLATWTDDRFQVDLANGVLRGWDGNPDATFSPVKFGFIGPRERPVAADMDGDGFDDLGLWVPDREGVAPREGAEWYFLISHGVSLLNRDVADPITGTRVIDFEPIPFGHDMYAQFGDDYSMPVVGNFDPPVGPTGERVSPAQSSPGVNNGLREDVDGDGFVSPRDAMLVISMLEQPVQAHAAVMNRIGGPYYDVNGDRALSPSDAILVINKLDELSQAPPTAQAQPIGEDSSPTASVRDQAFEETADLEAWEPTVADVAGDISLAWGISAARRVSGVATLDEDDDDWFETH